MRVRLRIWSLCSPRGRPSWRNGAVAAEGQEGTRDFRPPCAARRLATLSEAGGAGQYALPAPQRLAVAISGYDHSHARRCRDVGRRGLVGGRGPAGRGRPRRGGRVDAALRPAQRRELRHLLHYRRPARCPSGGRRPRRPALHPELRAAVRAGRGVEFRAGVHVGPHSPALRPLQQRPQVLDAARARDRPGRRPRRHRPLRARGPGARRTLAAAARRRTGTRTSRISSSR